MAVAVAASLLSCSATQEPSASPASLTPPPTASVDSPQQATADTGALEDSVRAYSDAYLGGNVDPAWDLLSERCQDRLSRPQFNGLVAGAEQLYGDAELQKIEVDELSGVLARVTYTFDDPRLDQMMEPWSFEAGSWRIDDC